VKSTHIEVWPIRGESDYGKGIFMFKRRLGQDQSMMCGHNCPQILEMTDGDFAAVGPDITTEAKGAMPPGPGVGTKEGVVKVPRKVMLAAMSEILATV
jgi:hypothetical protein